MDGTQQQQFSDLPPGAVVLGASPSIAPQFSDLPPGAQVLGSSTPASPPGMPATQPVPSPVPALDMSQVPGAVPGTPSPNQTLKPSTGLLDVAAAYPGALPEKVPANWTGKPVQLPKAGLPELAGAATAMLAPGTVMPGRLDVSPAEEVKTGVKELETPGHRATGALRVGAGAVDAAAPLAGPMMLESPGTFIRAGAEGYLAGKGAKYGTRAVGGTREQEDLAEDIGQMAPILAHAMLHPEITQGHTEAGNPAVQGTVRGKYGAGVEITPDEFIVRGGTAENPKELRIPRKPKSAAVEAPTIQGGPAQYSDIPPGATVVEEPKPVHHASNDIEDLRASAERQSEKIGDAVAKATEGVPGAKVEAVRDAKDSDRIEDKAERQNVQPSQVGDIAGAKVTVPHQEAANQVLDNLHQEMPVESANGEVTGEPGKNAVRQTQAIVDTGAPVEEPVKKAEVMLQTPEMAKATEKSHDDYRQAQELRAQGKEAEARQLESEISRQHEAADQAAQERIDALPKPSTGSVFQRPQEETGVSGRERGRVEPVQQGQETPTQGAQASAEKVERKPGQAPTPPTHGENLKDQKAEIRDSKTGDWKPGTILADASTPNWTGGQTIRRLRGVYDDGGKFNNVDIKDVRKPGQKQGIDFDGTLFKETSDGSIGAPIPERIASLKQKLANGEQVVIESHRAHNPGEISRIQDALESVGLPRLPVTQNKSAAPNLIDDKVSRETGVKIEKVHSNENTPLPESSKPFALREHEQDIAKPYGPPKKAFGGEVPEENLGFNHAIETGPDIGAKTRVETERRMGGPLPRGQSERRISEVAQPERDTAILARLEKEHPEWSLSRRLQEAAAIANPAGGKSLEAKAEEAKSAVSKEPVPTGSAAAENRATGDTGVEKAPKFKFGNTQAPIPANSGAAQALKTARDRISDSDLAGKGKETDPHVTVKYGIKGDDTATIRKFLSQQAPFEATLGKTTSFPPSEHSDGAAVIIAPIEAPELHRLNGEIEKHGDFAESNFKDYKPHATIAYVDPEKAVRYTGMSVTDGKKFTVDKVYITDREGNAEAVKLEGRKPGQAPKPLGDLVIKPIFGGKTETIPAEKLQASEPKAPRPIEKKPATGPTLKEGDKVSWEGQRGSKLSGTIESLDTQRGTASINTDQVVSLGGRIPIGRVETVKLDRLQWEGSTEQEKSEPAAGETKGAELLAQAVYEKLKAGESLGNVTELNALAEKHFGAARTSGTWTPKDAFDAMEAGVNKYLVEAGKELMEMPAEEGLAQLRELMNRLTSQGTRTEEQIKNQQFSTPPTESYIVAKVAGLKPSDVVLEPSAGNGGLAVWPKAIGAEVHVNEVAPRRQDMLELAGFGKPTAHDGEIINSLLDPKIKPTVILMNPPFSASTQKSYEAANRNQYGFNHVESALQRLEDGGRLVAILGGGRQGFDEGASLTASGARQWFQKIAQRYNIRANVRVSGKEYQKYGTSFATRIIVIDKNGPTPESVNYGHGRLPATIVNKSVDTLEEAYNALREVAGSRPEVEGGQPAKGEPSRDLEPNPEPRVPGVRQGTGGGGGTRGEVPATVSGRAEPESRPPASRPEGGSGATRVPEQESEPREPVEVEAPGRARGSAENDNPERQVARGGLDLEEVEAKAQREEEDEKDSAYVTYRPTLKGATHPGSIVETKAMATVPMPPLSYKPDLPESVVGKAPDYDNAKLSAVQLEAVAIAGMQNEITLPNGARASALIGDGTGVGKGRESAAILWDNWRKGRKRLVWMSKSKDLMQDAIRDLEGLGAKDLAKSIRSLGKINANTPIDHEGVLYTTYSLFRSGDKKGNTRAAQIDKWLRGNDDGEGGYLLMDESHNLKNAVVAQGQEASQVGEAVKKFLEKMPKLRTVSLSATAATDVMNLGYLDRLGLWGPGTPFPGGFPQFAGEISHGGMSAMEMIARELKSQGKYVSRTLTYKGVKYSEIEHKITEDQKKVYATAAKAWRSIQSSMEATIEHTTNGGSRQKALAMSQFYSTQQRFFGLLLSSMKIPTTVATAEKALAEGKSVAITLINTNEAAQNREKNRVAAEGDTEEEPDYDFGPGRLLKDMVMEHYPTQQYVDDVDVNGNPIKVPAVDADGHPIQNPQAVKERDALVAKMEKELHMPANPLDELIEQLGGPSKVAELTGRKQRYDPGTNRLVNRGGDGVSQDKINKSEEHAFQSGKKRIAILSSAADTGISLHADKSAANQQERFVITHQVGWSADKAMQMNGRFNRSNQTSAPEYALLKSDMGGESRFISSIARRMESLEALSKGQTKTNAGTDAMSKVNFETDQGRAATVAFYNQLLRNVDIPGTEDADGKLMSGRDVLKQLGVLKAQTGGGETVPPKERDNITRLLNRLLALEPDIQNAVYDYFYDIFDAVVKDAIEKGIIDTGVKRIPGDSFDVKEFRPLASDPTTGAKTFYYPVEAQERMERMPAPKFEEMLDKADRQDKHPIVMRHKENGKLLLAVDAKPIIKASGEQIDAVHVMRPTAGTPEKVALASLHAYEPVDKSARKQLEESAQTIADTKRDIEYYEGELKKTKAEDEKSESKPTYRYNNYGTPEYYQRYLDEAEAKLTQARKLRDAAKRELKSRDYLGQVKTDWQKQYEDAPTHKTKEHHLIGGAVMKYWNPIREAVGERMEVYSTVDAKTGQRVVGIEIPATHIQKLISRISGGKSTVTTAQIIPDVLKNATTYDLEGGIKISRGRVARENVVKFTTSDANIQRRLKDIGVIHEIGIQPIYYLPTNESKAGTILDKVLEEYPVKQEGKTADKPENLITGESGTFTPAKLSPSHIKQSYNKAVEEFISGKLKIGDKYHDVAKQDEVVANTLHLVDNAPRYFTAKGQANLAKVTKGLSDDQVRLVSLMVDSDSRDYLREKHPDEYKQAMQDPKIQQAIDNFKPLQDELTKDRLALGWPVRRSLSISEELSEGGYHVVDRDGTPVLNDKGEPRVFRGEKSALKFVEENGEIEPHLKRTYPEHSRSPLPGETGTGPYTGSFPHEKGLRPPKMDKKSREMSAEYHYEHGRKDFSGYIESFKQTKTAVLKQQLFDEFTDQATKWSAGTAQPPKIEYNGKEYYRPDIAEKAKRGGETLAAYAIYDPTRGEKFLVTSPLEGWATLTTGKKGIKASDRFLGPKQVVDAMENYDASRGGESGKLRKFFQEQIVGLFGPMVHINNILRHVGHATGLGTFDPRSWPSIARVIASPELRSRVMAGIDDATIDMLTQYGAYTDWGDIGSLNQYVGGNLNPVNWIRAFGKGILFDPKFAQGWGGLDPKARVVVADYFKAHYPEMTPAEIGRAVEDGFGNYNRANWTERQRLLAKFTLFPGWDAASVKWFLKHPFKVGVAGALVTLAINQALKALGKNKGDDSTDLAYVHMGDRKISSGLISDSMGKHLMAPVLGALQAKLRGDDVGAGAVEEGMRGSSALAGTLSGPIVEMVADQVYNRKYAGGAAELVKPEDKYKPGTWAPNVELEKRIAFAALKGSPALNRFIDNQGHWDWAQGLGGAVFGVTNFKYGAEERFKANLGKAAVYGQTLNQLAEQDPKAASEFVKDPAKATYLLFHDDLAQMGRDLKEIDDAIARTRSADLPASERQGALEDLKNTRNELLKAADGLNDALSERKTQARKEAAEYWKNAASQ